MSRPIKRVLDRLRGGVQRSGDGWKAPCPAHDDRNPSLSISEAQSGTVLLKCHAGCTFEEVTGALGLEPKDLYPTNGRREIVATYPYTDEGGDLLFQVVRKQGKQFRQRQPDGSGGWTWNLKGARRVLYRLPDVLEAAQESRVVFVAEGEKDVHTLERWGFTATCNPQGAGSWQESYSEALKGARVVILPDSDEAGKKHARKVARSVFPYARSVRVVELPGLPEGGDVSDWAAAGGTAERLRQLASETPALDNSPAPKAVAEEAPPEIGVLASDVERETVPWLWKDRLALGEKTILDGDPGIGKSTFLCEISSRVTTGRAMPGDEGLMPATPEAAGGVVLVTGEDSIAHTIRPRLEAAGADLNRCRIVQHVPDENDNPRPAVIPTDLDKLRRAVKSVEARLLIIDPLMAHLPGELNSHRDQDVRAALTPLARFARETECAVVVVRHLNKMQGASPLYRGGGSIGIIGAFRIGLLMGRDPEDEERLVLAPTKNNLARKPSSLAFRLEESSDVEGVARVKWEGRVSYSASDLLQSGSNGRSSPETDRAEAFLKEFLSEGARLSAEVYEAAEEAGIAEKTLKRAKKRLGIESERIKPGSRRWYFVPPWTEKDPAVKEATKEDDPLTNGLLNPEEKPRSEASNEGLEGKEGGSSVKGANSERDGPLNSQGRHPKSTFDKNGSGEFAGAVLEAATRRWAHPPITDEWLAKR